MSTIRQSRPPLPRPADDLIALWQERDRRYGLRRSASLKRLVLGDKEIAAILAGRTAEAERLPPPHSYIALEWLRLWTPANG